MIVYGLSTLDKNALSRWWMIIIIVIVVCTCVQDSSSTAPIPTCNLYTESYACNVAAVRVLELTTVYIRWRN
jgi:hypothetical protein